MFPTVASVQYIIDTFCILSLTHRTGSFVTMLAPLRDPFLSKDPLSAPLLLTTKSQYFARLVLITTTYMDGDLEFPDSQFVLSEDTNIERLLDVFMSSEEVLRLASRPILQFISLGHSFTTLRVRVGAFQDSHPWKAFCESSLRQLLREMEDEFACQGVSIVGKPAGTKCRGYENPRSGMH